MSLSRSAAVLRHELRVLRADAGNMISLMIMPLVMIAFLRPFAKLALREDHPDANGSEFIVPAMATMFAFFLVGWVGFTFIAERQWNTWERLRASPAGNAEVLIGKVIPGFMLAVLQQVVLFGGGVVLFGLRPNGSWLGLVVVALALCLSLTCVGVLLASIFKTNQQMNAFSNIGTMVLSGISGAFVPIDLLPGWVRTIAPISPQYWALRGYRSVILEGGGLGDVVLPIAVLILIGAVVAVIGLVRFSFDEPTVKVSAAAA